MLYDDPFLILGYGINSYFDIMMSMMRMFICITIYCLPMFYVYSKNEAKGLLNFVDKPKYIVN